MKSNLVRIFALAAVSMCALASVASAAPEPYVINTSESYLTAAIFLGGPPGQGIQVTTYQVLGSDTTSLSGTMSIDTSGGNISFQGGSIGLAYQPGVYLPDSNGGDATGPDPVGSGGSPAQIALQLITSIGLGTGYAAISGATSSVTDLSGPTAVSGGSFDASQQSININTANLAYWLNTTIAGLVYGVYSVGTSPPADSPPLSAQNGVLSDGYNLGYMGSVSTIGDTTTVTLPVLADAALSLSGVGIDVLFYGQIVASSVPEPSTLVLAGMGLVGGSMLVLKSRRRRRNAA